MRSHSLIGKVATVAGAIRGGDRPGEIRVVVQGIAHYYLAYAADPVPADAEVLIINYRGARQVDVEPWIKTPVGDITPGPAEGSK